jgi:NAD(P)-dependent dehydrogenase (short-subunit alcohol dehydrogenase family)
MDTQTTLGRTAVITGASRGIGAGLALEFAARGMNLALCARGDCKIPDGAETRTLVSQVDVRDESSMEKFAADTVERFGSIDLWINNAAVLEPIAPLRDLEVDSIRDHLEINLLGVFIGTRAFIRAHRARANLNSNPIDACLINMSSGAARNGYAGWSAYCAGKGGVDRLTEAVQLEEAETGLRAYSIGPGVVDTDMQELIRSCSVENFPMVDKFHQLKSEQAFNTIPFLASHLLRYAFDPRASTGEVCVRIPAEVRA